MSENGGIAPAKGRDSKSHSKGGKHSEHVSARKATALGGPKKGGAGGKGTWGKLEDDIAPVELARDDPAYGSDEEGAMERSRARPRVGRSMHNPERWAAQEVRDLGSFKKVIIAALEEFFLNEDAGEVAERVRSLESPVWHYEVVKRVITMAMDRANRERDLASRLISDLFGEGLLTSEEIGKGFERLFELADDLALDTPDAYKLLGQFLARAVADETLPPSYLMDPTVKALGGDVVADAMRLLSQKHSGTRLEHIFSSAHARTVAELKEEVRVMLEEYFVAGDVEEVRRCLQEMRSPFFHHEVVKRGVVLAFDRDDAARAAIIALLVELGKEGVISVNQAAQGVNRVLSELSDLSLDVPAAPRLVTEVVAALVGAKVLPGSYTKVCADAVAAVSPREAASPAAESGSAEGASDV